VVKVKAIVMQNRYKLQSLNASRDITRRFV